MSKASPSRMPSDIRVRRATLADRKGVLAIDTNLFDGLDYMPAIYTTLLQDPAFRPYVGVTPDEEIVAFMCVMVDEEERFCGMLSARTKKGYQGKRVIWMVGAKVVGDLFKDYGTLYDRFNVAADKPHYTQQYWAEPDRTLINREAFLTYISAPSRIAAAVSAIKDDTEISEIAVEDLNADRAYQILCADYTLEHIFQRSHLVAFSNSLPLTKSPKYLKKIATQCKVLASFKTDSTTKPNGISYMSMIRGPVHVNVNIHFHIHEHVNILLAHFANHLTHLCKLVPEDATLGLGIFFPASLDKEKVKDMLYPTMGANRIGKVHPREFTLVWKDAEMTQKSNL